MAALYIHIPYCRRKCIYCDFYSVGSARAPWQEYVAALLSELQCRRAEITEDIRTVYVGGGTPSQMPVSELQRLLGDVREIVGMHYMPTEVTIEANPEDVTSAFLDAITNCGVNRISIGIQSLNDKELKAVGRRHTANDAVNAVKLARNTISNVSIDLMFGLPGQTMDSWQEAVEHAIALGVQHISAYALMREEGTPLDIMLKQKRIETAAEDVTAAMYSHLTKRLREAAFKHYEISNYALPGYESQHNNSYWNSTPYIGLGPGAHSYDGKCSRRCNRANVKRYIEKRGLGEIYDTETLNQTELYEEFVMTRLRTAKGIDLSEAEALLGSRAVTKITERAMPFLTDAPHHTALLKRTDRGYALTEAGVIVSDTVISAIGFT